MADVIPLRPEPLVPHLSGTAQCVSCEHRWEAVAPVGTVELECPVCHLNTGRYRNLVGGAPGQEEWTCDCGCTLFVCIKGAGLMCARCGDYASGF